MSEYPKACTMEEAVSAVKGGGKASAKGKGESVGCWRQLVIVNGDVTHPDYDAFSPPPFLYHGWDYRIDAPIPVKTKDDNVVNYVSECVTFAPLDDTRDMSIAFIVKSFELNIERLRGLHPAKNVKVSYRIETVD